MHLAFGLVWAVVYARLAEPRLSGAGWSRGALFSLVPWVLSVTVFLPLVGAGFLGLGIGAGPLPLLGNLILHLAYGLTLGAIYGTAGDIDVERLAEPESAHHGEEDAEKRATESSEVMAARGLVAGTVAGALVGLIGLVVAEVQPEATLPGLDPLGFVVTSALLGAAFGGLIGSLAGLPSSPQQGAGG